MAVYRKPAFCVTVDWFCIFCDKIQIHWIHYAVILRMYQMWGPGGNYMGWCYLSRIVTKPTKWRVRPAKTQISLGIRPVWSESLLSAWRKLGSLATHWAHSEDSDQTGWIPRLIWVFAGRTCHFVGFVTMRLIYVFYYNCFYVQVLRRYIFWKGKNSSQLLQTQGLETYNTMNFLNIRTSKKIVLISLNQ